VALSALDIVQETLDKKRTSLPFEELTDVMDSALERLGYGTKAASSPTVVVNTNAQIVAPISAEDLAAARAKVIAHENKLLDVGQNAAPPASEPAAGLESERRSCASED